MVRIAIESDNKVAVIVKKDDGTARLLRDLKEDVIDESNDETFTVNTEKIALR